ncbi:NupC/NupG family nucleoside CNT transporter [Pacificimonas sp. WHA3]|uniref:NupC/NupG family nucleoside CNT transporter n=1 Tax=Pacificimonas pallii TaxID=2827236 RepID=A0ABS6SH92_9SPHN|nr:nucleoside transporter C-terminal domain-containing protein [Pacificimonas pallii]MBV7257784.1 NupC/NupG family nucleoside CNT transporter [Pacificimonas pallii]
MLAIIAVAILFSTNRRAIRIRTVGPAFLLQAGMAILVLYTPWGRAAIGGLSRGVSSLLGYAQAGTNFVFGPLASPEIGGSSFLIAALPVIIFFAALVSVLYHIGIMQIVIRWVGGGLKFITGISRVEALCSAANIFVGQSESPLTVKPFLRSLAPEQLFVIMTVGMAGVAGTILAAYAALLGDRALPYLLAASFMSAPGGILMAKLIMPDPPGPIVEPEADLELEKDEKPANIIMAAAEGAQIGLKIAVAVGAMVLAFVGLIALANGICGWIGDLIGAEGLSFQQILGYIFAPIMYLLGIPWAEAGTAGSLFGEKIVLNEFVAFISLSAVEDTLSERTVAVVTFALCGFANLSSIAIQMAVTGSLAPNQRPVIARLGLRALLAGSLANLMSAALAGMILSL